MGADLYINPLFEQNSEKYQLHFNMWVGIRDKAKAEGRKEEADNAQIEVTKYYNLMNSEGYFRDPYNSSDLLWQFNLSWWDDINPQLINGQLNVRQVRWFLELLDGREAVFERNLTDLLEGHNKVWDKKENYPKQELTKKERKEWVLYYHREYSNLKKFLMTAIELKSPVDCSL